MVTTGTNKKTVFEQLLENNNDHTGLSLLLLLAWISASDGNISEQEKKDILTIATAGKNQRGVPAILSIALKNDIPSIQLACEIIKATYTGERANLFMELAIGLAISDRYLLPSENHVLRFLADLLGVTKTGLNREFKRITGKPLPEAPDVSSHVYWNAKRNANRGKQRTGNASGRSSSKRSNVGTQGLNGYYATLGLEPGASSEEIKSAYRRLAKVHHPDRFQSLGDEAVEAAHVTFTRIQDAYDNLKKYA